MGALRVGTGVVQFTGAPYALASRAIRGDSHARPPVSSALGRNQKEPEFCQPRAQLWDVTLAVLGGGGGEGGGK